MFISTGNNFGAGVIQFKDVREGNYLILNAKFTCSPQDADYQAADVLEIYVPNLPFDRSTETSAVVRFLHRETTSGRQYNYDAGTVVKTWIKDANTICLEKLSVFDDQEELIIYIQTLYCQLGKGNPQDKRKQKRITAVTDGNYLYIDTTYTICVVYDRWVFFHFMYSGCSFAARSTDWEAMLQNLPEDINIDVPIMASYNYRYSHLAGVTEMHLEDGFMTFPASERSGSWDNTGNNPFVFGFLIRDNEPEPEVPGRLRLLSDSLDGGQYYKFTDVDMELIPIPAMVACTGSTAAYNQSTHDYTTDACPDEIPAFEAFFLASCLTGSGMPINLVEVELTKSGSTTTVTTKDNGGLNNLAFTLNDTAIAMIKE